MEELVHKAVGLQISPRRLYEAHTKRLVELSACMPPRRVLHNSCYGSFGYSKHFGECFGNAFASRHDPVLVEAVNDFGRANAKMFEKAFAAYVIYQKYDFDAMIRRANALYLKEQNENDIANLLRRMALQQEFGNLEATYEDVRASQGLGRFTQASLLRAKGLLEIELSLWLSQHCGPEPPYFTDSFYPAYRRYQESKKPAYYEPCSMLSSLLKDANSPRAWLSAPGYQAFGMSFLYENAAPSAPGKVYDPFDKACIDVPESAYEGFGLLCASGESANLRFADVPALVDYYIASTDGLEEVRWELPGQQP